MNCPKIDSSIKIYLSFTGKHKKNILNSVYKNSKEKNSYKITLFSEKIFFLFFNF